MAGLARVHEKCRGTGAGQGGGDLVTDMPGFAHAGDDDAAPAVENHLAGGMESIVDTIDQRGDRLGLGFQHRDAEILERVFAHGWE